MGTDVIEAMSGQRRIGKARWVPDSNDKSMRRWLRAKDHAHALWAVFLGAAAVALILSGSGSWGYIVGGLLALMALLQAALWVDS